MLSENTLTETGGLDAADAAEGNLAGVRVKLPAQAITGGLFFAVLDLGGPVVFDETFNRLTCRPKRRKHRATFRFRPQVYLARHRAARLVKKEIERLRKELE